MTTTITSQPDAACPPGVVLPHDPAYDTARRAWNLSADQRPAGVAVTTSVEDVQAALAYARAHGLTVLPQTTGHFATAMPSLERSLLLRVDLHDGEVLVDVQARRATIRAGAVWGDVVGALAPHGLAAMHGSSPSVGVVGYLLGGGLSFYGRAHGLAVNHVTAIECVTADGVHRRVDATTVPDLFWALRGGGGGFAVVTAVELGLLELDEVHGGAIFWPADHAPALLDTWLAWTRDAPASVTSTFRVLCLPPVEDVPPPLRATPVVCVDGVGLDPAAGDVLAERLLAVADPLLGGFGSMPPAAVVRLHGDPEEPVPGVGDGFLVEDLDADGAAAWLAVATGGASPFLACELRHLGGALAGPAPEGAGVRGSLEGAFLAFAVGVPMGPVTPEACHVALDLLADALAPWATGTQLLSFAERGGRMRACVAEDALERLRTVKATVDPDGLLLVGHDLV